MRRGSFFLSMRRALQYHSRKKQTYASPVHPAPTWHSRAPRPRSIALPLPVRCGSGLATVVMRHDWPGIVAGRPTGPHDPRDEVGVLARHEGRARAEQRIEATDVGQHLAPDGQVRAVHDPWT